MKRIIELPDDVVKAIQNGEDYRYDIHTAIAQSKPYEERPKGEWIELPKAFDSRELPCKCSICSHILSFMNYYSKSNFCPDCGADMRTKENSNG